MAEGPAHYKMAELILDEAKKFMAENIAEVDDASMNDLFANHAAMLAQAQVHATLALAAATAMNIRRNGAVESVDDAAGWERVLGVSE